MRCTRVFIAAAIIGLSAASTANAATPPPSVLVQADCAGITVTVSGHPDGTSVIVGVDSEPPYGFTFGEADPWGRFQPQSDGTVVGHLIPGNYAVAHPPFHVIVGVVGSNDYTDYVVTDCPAPVVTTAPATPEPAVVAPRVEVIAAPVVDYTIWADVAAAPPW
jgi:hypothetical protein